MILHPGPLEFHLHILIQVRTVSISGTRHPVCPSSKRSQPAVVQRCIASRSGLKNAKSISFPVPKVKQYYNANVTISLENFHSWFQLIVTWIPGTQHYEILVRAPETR